MATRIGFGRAVRRSGVEDISRYVAPRSVHVAAAWLAAAAPLLGILLLMGTR